jgi:lysozyme
MNVDQLRKELAEDEGCKYEIYLDHLGYPTFGIGHLIRVTDPEHEKPVGTPVTEDRVKQAFEADVEQVLNDCTRLYDNFYLLPEEVQLIIANMMFNLGYPRLEKFKDMYFNISTRNWQGAANEMVNSKWYRQVTNRAERLVQRMRQVDA